MPFYFSFFSPLFARLLCLQTNSCACVCVCLTELAAALNSLEKIAWVRLDDDSVRFTVIPDTGSQVWAYVSTGHSVALTVGP